MPKPTVPAAGEGLAAHRRTFLRQLAAAGALTVPVAAAAVARAGDADAELVRLGAEFERHFAEYLVLWEEGERALALVDDEADDKGLLQGSMAWLEFRKEKGGETAIEITNDKADELDKIAKRIRAIPAAGIVGLAVKASLLPFAVHNMEDEIAIKNGTPMDDLDWVTECLNGFVAEIRGMARLTTGGAGDR
jgi:hypothetical protein